MACPSVDSLLPVTRNTLNPHSINLLYNLSTAGIAGQTPFDAHSWNPFGSYGSTLHYIYATYENQRKDNSNSYATFGLKSKRANMTRICSQMVSRTKNKDPKNKIHLQQKGSEIHLPESLPLVIKKIGETSVINI